MGLLLLLPLLLGWRLLPLLLLLLLGLLLLLLHWLGLDGDRRALVIRCLLLLLLVLVLVLVLVLGLLGLLLVQRRHQARLRLVQPHEAHDAIVIVQHKGPPASGCVAFGVAFGVAIGVVGRLHHRAAPRAAGCGNAGKFWQSSFHWLGLQQASAKQQRGRQADGATGRHTGNVEGCRTGGGLWGLTAGSRCAR